MGFLSGLGRRAIQILLFFCLYEFLKEPFSFGLPWPLSTIVSIIATFLLTVVLSYVLTFMFGNLLSRGEGE